jgi:arginine/ornithine N-succinyltransferase beta subunit
MTLTRDLRKMANMSVSVEMAALLRGAADDLDALMALTHEQDKTITKLRDRERYWRDRTHKAEAQWEQDTAEALGRLWGAK